MTARHRICDTCSYVVLPAIIGLPRCLLCPRPVPQGMLLCEATYCGTLGVDGQAQLLQLSPLTDEPLDQTSPDRTEGSAAMDQTSPTGSEPLDHS